MAAKSLWVVSGISDHPHVSGARLDRLCELPNSLFGSDVMAKEDPRSRVPNRAHDTTPTMSNFAHVADLTHFRKIE